MRVKISILGIWILTAILLLWPARRPASADHLGAASHVSDGVRGSSREERWPYIVRLQDEPLATYRGEMASLAATSPELTGQPRLDVRDPNSRAYLAYLTSQQTRFLARLLAVVPTAKVLQSYQVVYNGIVVMLTPAEVERVAKLPGVVAIQRDEFHHPVTSVTPEFIGATTIWDGQAGTKGEGIIVGVIDTGVWPEHPSFADDGTFPPAPDRWNGDCTPPAGDSYACNHKLIGIQSFLTSYVEINHGYDGLFSSGRDDDGHGTHTASTAAGDEAVPVTLLGVDRGVVSGVAPRAQVAAYKACGPKGCTTSDLVAAINKAVADGVDVINYSIGGGIADPWNDAESLALLAAREAGVFAAVAAGNDGPGPNTINSPANAPWVMAVGASTSNRAFISEITVEGPGEGPRGLWGASLTAGVSDFNLVDAEGIADSAGDTSGLCLNPFRPGTFQPDDAVLCRRGEIARVLRGDYVAAGGGGAVILYNPRRQGLAPDNYVIPAVHVDRDVGQQLKDYVTAHPGQVTISFTPGTARFAPDSPLIHPDRVAEFSSRGPMQMLPSVIKPDVTAPGVQILAGAAPEHIGVGAQGELFQVAQGTSMAGPHVAGAAALLRALHPRWSPASIQSALMTTAKAHLVKADGTTPADPFDSGAGRIDVARAADLGLVFEMAGQDYVRGRLAPETMNLPSLGFGKVFGRAALTRTVTSLLDVQSTWHISYTASSGVAITVLPDPLVVPPAGTAVFEVVVDAANQPAGTYFAQLYLAHDQHRVHVPIALEQVPASWTPLTDVRTQFDAGRHDFHLQSGLDIDPFVVKAYGLVDPDVTPGGPVVQDADSNPNTDPLGAGFGLHRYVLTADTLLFAAEMDLSVLRNVRLSLLFDADRSGTFEWPREIVGVAGGPDTTGTVQAISPEPGDYLVAVYVPAGVESYTLKAFKVLTGDGNRSLHMLDVPARIAAGTDYLMQVAWDHQIDQDEAYLGVVTMGSESDPTAVGLVPVRVTGDMPAIRKSASRDTVRLGETVDYEIVLANAGSQARTMRLTDVLPDGLAVDPASLTGGATISDGVMTWSGVLPRAGESGASVQRITYRARAASVGALANLASVTSDGRRDDAGAAIRVLQPPAVPPGRHSLLVRVFVDGRCDTQFSEGVDLAMAGIPVSVRFSNGAVLRKDTLATGLVLFTGFDVGDPVEVGVGDPAAYRGRVLDRCRNSPARLTLTPEDFGPLRSKFVTFRYGISGEVSAP